MGFGWIRRRLRRDSRVGCGCGCGVHSVTLKIWSFLGWRSCPWNCISSVVPVFLPVKILKWCFRKDICVNWRSSYQQRGSLTRLAAQRPIECSFFDIIRIIGPWLFGFVHIPSRFRSPQPPACGPSARRHKHHAVPPPGFRSQSVTLPEEGCVHDPQPRALEK